MHLACYGCDRDDAPLTVREARRQGWRDIKTDNGPLWTHTGWCPACWMTDEDSRGCVPQLTLFDGLDTDPAEMEKTA